MSLFGTNSTSIRYGSIVEIGSGSVLVAIIASDPTKSHPDIIWSKREYTPLRTIHDISDSSKNVMTSLLNALMLLDSEGRAALRDKTGKNRLPETQVMITAPWSYTVTKTITYAHDEPFTLSKDLVEELLRTAHTKVTEELADNQAIHNFGLSVIARSATGLIANGYTVRVPGNQLIKNLKIIESSAVVQDYLIDELKEVQEKILPETELFMCSFILVYYFILTAVTPETKELCLIDITFEATEIGIVRDGILTYCSHIPYGSFSIAREIAAELHVPLEEALGYLHYGDPTTLFETLNQQSKKSLQVLFSSYQDKLVGLLKETGDTLSIPKKIYLHGDTETEEFFKNQISEAAKKTTDTSHAVFLTNKDLLFRYYTDAERQKFVAETDTAMLISAQFFHTNAKEDKFEEM